MKHFNQLISKVITKYGRKEGYEDENG